MMNGSGTSPLKLSPVARKLPEPVTPIASSRWLVTLCILAGVALALSAYLAYVGMTEASVPGCGGGEVWDCDGVIATRWGSWLNIPVGIPGVALFASVLATAAFLGAGVPEHVRRLAARILTALAVVTLGSALWFTLVQVLHLGKLCYPCLAVHGCGAAIAGMTGWQFVRTMREPWPLFAGCAPVMALMMGQIIYEPQKYVVQSTAGLDLQVLSQPGSQFDAQTSDAPLVGSARLNGTPPTEAATIDTPVTPANDVAAAEPSTNDPPTEETLRPADQDKRTVKILEQLDLVVNEHPHIGSPHAKHVLVLMVDYTCHHCRQLSQQMARVRPKFGDRLTLVVLPTPLNQKCNPAAPAKASASPEHALACAYADLSVKVWLTNPKHFAAFHDWLMTGATPPPFDKALERAVELVGSEGLLVRATRGRAANRVNWYGAKVYAHSGAGALPKLLINQHVLYGEFASDAQLLKVLTERLGFSTR